MEIGLVVAPLRILFDYAWFAGGIGSAATYALLMQSTRIKMRDGVSAV